MMITAKSIKEIRRAADSFRKRGESIGFVPTMGALHEGHLSLVRRSKRIADRTIVSIFVNPIQFSPAEDLNRYPRPIQDDMRLLRSEGTDALFLPAAEEMYSGRETSVRNDSTSLILCGMTRKNHFEGVLTVVAKLFNIVSPDFAFFGEKDYQQFVLIKKMADDLDFRVRVIPCPIVRERDGLAMSSRNAYLSIKQRREAPIIRNTLLYAGKLFSEGVARKEIERISGEMIEENSSGRVEYVKLYTNELKECSGSEKKCRIFAAVRFGSTRLIDNTEVGR